MSEPEQLKRGKQFHKLVQKDYLTNSLDEIFAEKVVILSEIKNKAGRMDLFIPNKDESDYVVIIEIKGTDWDRIKPQNIKRNLRAHQRQIYKYIDKFVEGENIDASVGIIYPKPPIKEGLREFIEDYIDKNNHIPIYWYSEIKTVSE